MPSFKHHLTVQTVGIAATVFLVAAAVACGSSDPDPTATASAPASSPPAATATTPPLPRLDPTATSAPSQNPTTPTQPTDSEQGQLPVPSTAGTLFDWRIDDIDEGTKPAITVNADGVPSVAYMLEAINGLVKNAQLLDGSWNITTVSEGYFYGPLDIDTGADGQPQIVWHDHQSGAFQPELGDVEYAVLNADGEWRFKTFFDVGHDGWDTRMFIDSSGTVHVSAIDPQEFNGSGVEYYQLASETSELLVEQVGSGSLTYRWATSVSADDNGTVYLTYYAQPSNDLIVAVRKDGEWTRETVDTAGNAGVFNDVMVGPDGRVHVSYVTLGIGGKGTVKYATRGADGTEWVVMEIAVLSDITLGMEGARNITSIDVAPNGNPWIAFGDESRTSLAIFDGSKWLVEDIETSDDQGMQVSLAIDAAGRPHIGFFRLLGRGPLKGVIRYAVGTPN